MSTELKTAEIPGLNYSKKRVILPFILSYADQKADEGMINRFRLESGIDS